MAISGAHAFLEILANSGVRYLFGNPGTSELPLCDAIAGQDRIRYILGLQEVPVMAMADGYSMASGTLGVVNLHISVGLGNAMGMLYNAWREGTPLLVTAGQQDRRLRMEEPILWGDMVSVARPWTKWAVEVESLHDLPGALRRAVRLALTPPTGPVFMSLPMDLQMELGEIDTSGVRLHDTRVRPPLEALERAADVLASARNPAILAGSRVVERDGVQELVTVAEALGAPVFTEPNHTHGRLGFPANHPLYAQVVPHWSPQIRETLKEFDVLLVAGMDLVRQYVYHEPSCPVPEHIKVVHLDEDARELGKNLPIEVGLLGDTKAGLQELGTLLAPRLTKQASQIAQRRTKREERHARDRENRCSEIDKQRSIRPMTPKVLMDTIARRLPENVAVVEEAVTTTNTVLERLGALKNTTGYFGHRGWGLGWGLNCAIGAQLAWPDRPVMAILGEGAALYGIQGLWSAAKYGLGVTVVIANNAQYQILKAGARGLGLPEANREKFVGMDLREPEVDLVGLAKAFGVDAVRVTDPEELDEQLRASLGSEKPTLIDVPIRRSLAGPGE